MAVQKNQDNKPYTLRRFLKIFLPFIILLFVFGSSILGSFMRSNPPTPITTSSITPQAIGFTLTPTSEYRVAEKSPAATINSFSEYDESDVINKADSIPDDQTIDLAGPPLDSKFRTTDNITFYWFWPLELAENQMFSLVIENSETETITGNVNMPSIGNNGYQFSFSPAEIKLSDDALHWRIQLVNDVSGAVLTKSQDRAIFIISSVP